MKLYNYLDYDSLLCKTRDRELWDLIRAESNRIQRDLDKQQKHLIEPTLETSFENFVVFLGLPKVPSEKTKLLEKFFKKKLFPAKKIDPASMKSVEFELEEAESKGKVIQKTTGVAIMEFNDNSTASTVVKEFDSVKFDKKHTMRVVMMEEFEYLFGDEDFQESQFKTKQELNGWAGALDSEVQWTKVSPAYSDSLVLNAIKRESQVHKHIKAGKQIKHAQWSRSGNYHLLLESNGVRVFGGDDFEFITFFKHANVRSAMLSPNEKYLVSYNGTIQQNNNRDDKNLKVWDFFTGRMIRYFKVINGALAASFQFDSTSGYFSRLSRLDKQNSLCVYELPSMMMTEDPKTGKRCQMDVFNPIACKWSQSRSQLAVLCGSLEDTSAVNSSEIKIFSMPERTLYKWVALTQNIVSGSLFWSQDSNYLVAHLTYKIKKKLMDIVQVGKINFLTRRSNVTNLEYLEKKESTELFLSPNRLFGTLIISSPESKTLRRVVVYGVQGSDRGVFYHNKILELKRTKFQVCEWGPMNKRFILGDKSLALFCEVSRSRKKKQNKWVYNAIKSVEMDKYDKISFSPCGRFVCFVTEAGDLQGPKKDVNLTMKFYTCYGEFIKKEVDRQMRTFLWRRFPLPDIYSAPLKSRLTALEKKVVSNEDELDNQDLKIVDEMKFQRLQKEKQELEQFETFIQTQHDYWNSRKEHRVRVLGFDEDRLVEEDYVEVVIEDKREIIRSFKADQQS